MSATCVEGVKKRDWRDGFDRVKFRVAAAVRGSWVLESWKGVELAGLEGCVRLKRGQGGDGVGDVGAKWAGFIAA